MLCTRCKKYPAVVFLTTNQEDGAPNGLCIKCAKELGIKPVDDIMQKMGISEEDLDAVQDQLAEFMSFGDMEGFDQDFNEQIMSSGAQAFPFLNNIFGEQNQKENIEKTEDKNKKDDKKSFKKKSIEKYCYNLTQRARNGELDVIIGRDKEIARAVQILSRRTKNNPCLIGEPGVGKTAIAEALAIRIAQGKVPSRLRNKEVQLLDLTSLVAGTQFRGQFESRIKGLVEEIKKAGNIILFIDEVHNLVGTGDSEGTMSAANILKPALSRGEIQVIGATTFNEYRKYIEKDSALERRFQPITVLEPTVKESIDVLKGIKSYYEGYHRVKISDRLISRIVNLSERYITDRFLPDKAIDLMDEACACAALRNIKMEEYDNIVSKIENLKDEEKDLTSEDQKELDYEKLAKVRYEIARLEDDLKLISNEALNSSVTDEDVAHVIELWTGIPASKIQENELKKLRNLEDHLKDKVKGQEEAIKAVSSAIKRSRVQLSLRRVPSSFIFVGPTGVGKTELAKVLSKELFDVPDSLIRLDMSEFMEKHSVSKIIGSPPGYVGYDEAGQLTEKVRRNPYSVLLFDEIEKAHPDVMNILLQILDEGRITDSHGRVVNFENTIIIMTSNAGSDKKENAMGFAKSENELSKEKAMKALSEFLRPEFLSRINEIIVFKNLSKEDMRQIAKLMLEEYRTILEERELYLEYSDDVLEYLAEKSVGAKSGARNMRNLIRREVEDKIANVLVESLDETIKKIELYIDEGIKIKLF